MNTTLRHIEYLVTVHNCVVVSGLGAILVRRVPADFDEQGVLHAPRRVYAFNPDITQSDGLLENSVARGLKVSYDRACTIVSDDVEAMRRQLTADGSLSLGRVGTISRSPQGTVTFAPYDSDMLSPLASWLPVVEPVERYRASATIDTEAVAAEFASRRRSRLAVFGRAAAACVGLVTFALIASTPIRVANTHMASTAPTVTAPCEAYVPSVKAPVLQLTIDEALPEVDTVARAAYQTAKALEIKQAAQAKPAQVKVLASTEQTAVTPRFVVDDSYRVIVASVSNIDEAQSFIDSARKRYGGQYGFIESGSRVRIYAATGASAAQARAQVGRGYLANFKDAWVCAD